MYSPSILISYCTWKILYIVLYIHPDLMNLHFYLSANPGVLKYRIPLKNVSYHCISCGVPHVLLILFGYCQDLLKKAYNIIV